MGAQTYITQKQHCTRSRMLALTKDCINRALECDQFGRTCDLISQGCDKKKTLVALVRPAVRENKTKVSATQKVSLLFDNRHVSLISWSKPIRDSEGRTPPLIGRGPDIPVCVCVCVRLKMRVLLLSNRERLVVEMHAALSLNLLYSVNVWQSLQDYAIAELSQNQATSAIFQIAADFALRRVLWRHRNAHCQRKVISQFQKWNEQLCVLFMPDLQELHQTNEPKAERIRATRLGYRPFICSDRSRGLLSITRHRYTQRWEIQWIK